MKQNAKIATKIATPVTASLFSRNTSTLRRKALRGLPAGSIPGARAEASPSGSDVTVASPMADDSGPGGGSAGRFSVMSSRT